jgi:hypothetical protein
VTMGPGRKILRHQRSLNQGALMAKQGALGAKQGALGAKQGALGAKQGPQAHNSVAE